MCSSDLKTPHQIKEYVFEIVDYLISRDVKAVVMACNTSSAIAYEEVAKKYDIALFEVIKTAVKSALNITKNGKIGVIANEATVRSNVYSDKIRIISGNNVISYQKACPLLVPLIESGNIDTPKVKSVLMEYLLPLKKKNIDTLILGCTHYPHVSHVIGEILPGVNILNPAKYIINNVKKYLEKEFLLSDGFSMENVFVTSQDTENFKIMGSRLTGLNIKDVILYDYKDNYSLKSIAS